MRSIRMLSAAVLAASGLIAVGVTTEAANAASSKDLNVNHTQVMKLETFTASGRVSTNDARTVKLQYRNDSDDPWTTKSTKTSNASGYFSFSVTTGRTRYYRYYAPKNGSDLSIKGNSRKVTVVPQTASAYISPSELTYFCASPGVNQTVYAVAKFSPARPGRDVSFTSPNGTPIEGTQDSKGHVVMPFNITKPAGKYSIAVTAEAYLGASAVSAPTTSIQVNHLSIFCP